MTRIEYVNSLNKPVIFDFFTLTRNGDMGKLKPKLYEVNAFDSDNPNWDLYEYVSDKVNDIYYKQSPMTDKDDKYQDVCMILSTFGLKPNHTVSDTTLSKLIGQCNQYANLTYKRNRLQPEGFDVKFIEYDTSTSNDYSEMDMISTYPEYENLIVLLCQDHNRKECLERGITAKEYSKFKSLLDKPETRVLPSMREVNIKRRNALDKKDSILYNKIRKENKSRGICTDTGTILRRMYEIKRLPK